MKNIIVSVLGAVAVAYSANGQLIPGDKTDRTAKKPNTAAVSKGFEDPDQWEHPYISTYYVEPVVDSKTDTKIKYFVTDWNHSLIRSGDTSHRFAVTAKFSSDGGRTWTSKVKRAVKSGDNEISLGRLKPGEYMVSIQAQDSKKRLSHVVYHEFIVKESLSAKEKVMRVTDADLKRCKINPNGDYGTKVFVDVGDLSKIPRDTLESVIREKVSKAAIAGKASVRPDGYTIFIPSSDKKPLFRSWSRSEVVYGSKYNEEAVEEEAYETGEGLKVLIFEAKAAGYDRVILPKGTYRVSAFQSLIIPENFTLDLGGSTLKMNKFTGASACVVKIANTHHSHVVNGTIEGDYYEHDYANSPDNSEWPMGISFNGDVRYSSFENLTIRDITGYGGGCGIDGTHTFFNAGSAGRFEPGGLRLNNGEVNKKAKFQFTSGFKSVSEFVPYKYISVSRYLGYQGMGFRSWNYIVAFYDKEKKFISADVARFYRLLFLPKNAAYMRITVLTDNLQRANGEEVSMHLFRYPWNCAIKNVRFERCRCVGLAPAAMRNMLIEGCEFTQSGENLAKCAFDAEDGWDMMQDVTIRNNNFFDNPNNELLTCAGHNFVIENNTANIYLWDRCNSPCVRGNKSGSATYRSGSRNRTGYGRYDGNDVKRSITLGASSTPTGWDQVITDDFIIEDGREFALNSSATGRFRGSKISGKVRPAGGNFDACTFNGSAFVMTKTPFNFVSNIFNNCSFEHCNTNGVWNGCVLNNCKISSSGSGDIKFINSTVKNTKWDVSYWTTPMNIFAEGSSFELGVNDNYFIRMPSYSIGSITMKNNTFKGGKNASVITVYDNRPQDTDNIPGTVDISDNTFTKSFDRIFTLTSGKNESVKTITFTFDKNKSGASSVKGIDPDSLADSWKVNKVIKRIGK